MVLTATSFTLKNISPETSFSLPSGQAGLKRVFLSRRLHCDGLAVSECHVTFHVGGGLVGLTWGGLFFFFFLSLVEIESHRGIQD